jgi:hypothetical protein
MGCSGDYKSTGTMHDMPIPPGNLHLEHTPPGQHDLMVAVGVKLRLVRVGSEFGAHLGCGLIQKSLQQGSDGSHAPCALRCSRA